MRVNRGLVFWGVALVTAGAVALAIQSNLIAANAAREAWRLWPIVLIAIGLAVISARTPFALVGTLAAGIVAGGLTGTLVAGWPDGLSIGCGGETNEQVSADGSFGAASAEVVLDFNCGDLHLTTGDGSDWTVDARHASGAEPMITSDDGALRARAKDGPGFMGFADGRQAWDVRLPTEVRLALDIEANAASSRLNLDGADLSELSLDANAGEVDLRLGGASVDALTVTANAGSLGLAVDGDSAVNGSIEMNAGSLELCVDPDVAIAITVDDDNVTFSHDLDASGLTLQGDRWSSGDGEADVTLDVEGNAASFTYNPDGGCS